MPQRGLREPGQDGVRPSPSGHWPAWVRAIHGATELVAQDGAVTAVCPCPPGSNVMRSIHGVGELMTQVVLRGGGFLPVTPMAAAPEGNVKQAEPEKEDILVMDTKLKIIEILQVTLSRGGGGESALRGAVTSLCGPALMGPGACWEGEGGVCSAQPQGPLRPSPGVSSPSPLPHVPWSLQLRRTFHTALAFHSHRPPRLYPRCPVPPPPHLLPGASVCG